MPIYFMRYLIDPAGDIEFLTYAVKIANEVKIEDPKYLWEAYVKKYFSRIKQKIGSKKIGVRFPEPHFAFARELKLLESERWIPTFSYGKAFILLSEKFTPPQYFLLAQLLYVDRTLLIPFLIKLLNSPKWQKRKTIGAAAEILRETWIEMWKKYPKEMEAIEPPQPYELSLKTSIHWATPRVRFLGLWQGSKNNLTLNLSENQIRLLVKQFENFVDKELPPDLYFRIGFALTGKKPKTVKKKSLMKEITQVYNRLKGIAYASAFGTFSYINQKILPTYAVDWDFFKDFIKKSKKFRLQPSLNPDDILFKVRENE